MRKIYTKLIMSGTPLFLKAIVLLILVCYANVVLMLHNGVSKCSSTNNACSPQTKIKYLFYDVNSPEGFNLRRDVYLRMSILINQLAKVQRWVLVLPPWTHLYHWKSSIYQNRLSWSQFFDVASMQKFAPVIEFVDFCDMVIPPVIDEVFVLQHFEEMFVTGNFEDKLEVQECFEKIPYSLNKSTNFYVGPFWGVDNVVAKKVNCLTYHGSTSIIVPTLHKINAESVMLDHAEILLHDRYGDAVYWRARRSMRFSLQLRQIADEFRERYLNSSNDADNTRLPSDWTLEKARRSARGGPYLSVHLRRRDFVRSRSTDVPSLTGLSKQLQLILARLQLKMVFIATDAPQHEKDEIHHLLEDAGYQMVTFQPSEQQVHKYLDGGIAIIEQIICAHGRKFYGTHESTFSFRIQEEREILGFSPEMTFNRLCGDNQATCQQPSKWLIEY